MSTNTSMRWLSILLIGCLPVIGFAQPVAAFNASPTSAACPPAVITLTDQSTGGIVSWEWSFSDGTTSAVQNPTYTITEAGTHGFSLIVTDGTGAQDTAGFVVQVQGSIPYYWLNQGTCMGLTLNFVDATISQPGIVAWQWDFGDGNTSAAQNPQHTYTAPGTYIVTHTVTDANGCTVSKQTTVNPTAVGGPILTTAVSPNTACQPPYNGTASTIANGGTPPYAYLWNNGATSPFIFNLEPGLYWVEVSDANGCTISDTVEILNLGGLGPQITGVVSDAGCDSTNNGTIDITLTGVPPYSVLWSTGDTTEDISNLAPGVYTVTVSDSDSTCSAFTMESFVVVGADLGLTFSTTDAACDGTGASASITSVTNGVAPYTYLWNTGDTMPFISGISPGGYSVDVMDALGCLDHQAFFVEYADSCVMNIAGRVFLDLDSNCNQSFGDAGIHAWVLLNGALAALTDSSGAYSLTVPIDTYEVSAVTAFFGDSLTCLPGGFHTLLPVTDTAGIDFAWKRNPDPDLRVFLTKSPIRPGFSHDYFISVYNDGGTMLSPTVSLQHDSLVTWTTHPLQSAYDPVNRIVTWNLPSLNPGQSFWYAGMGMISPGTALGTSISTSIGVDPINGDVTPANNRDTCQVLVVGSFDPNDKQVTPAGEGAEGNILATQQELKYTVRFQNTGTDTAFFVTVRDTLDQDLDITTLQPGLSSHLYSLTVEEDSILVFFFDNILLVDSFRNEPESNGYVSFLIRHKGTLPLGREITNRAAIYFDFNEPVITNTVINTIFAPVGIIPLLPEDAISAYPNPARDVIHLEYGDLELTAWELLDIQGRTQLAGKNLPAGSTSISLTQLPAGIYLLRVWAGDKRWIRRVLKQ